MNEFEYELSALQWRRTTAKRIGFIRRFRPTSIRAAQYFDDLQ
jgi:hypothetical protein